MFIGRRLDGTIYGAWTSKQPMDEFHLNIEEVSDDHPDYVAFKTRPPKIYISVDEKIAALEAKVLALESK